MKYWEIKPKHESLMAFYSRLATKTETTMNVGEIMNLMLSSHPSMTKYTLASAVKFLTMGENL